MTLFRRYLDPIDAFSWSKVGDTCPGVQFRMEGDEPFYFVYTINGELEMKDGQKVWVWLSRFSIEHPDALEMYEVMSDALFKQHYVPVEG